MLREFFSSLPSKLFRVTSGGRVIREIDGLRFLAIFPVVIQHLSERLERNTGIVFQQGNEFDIATFITNRGFIGVYVFFIISGFILAKPFAAYRLKGGRKISLKSYYIRRLTRLEPPYIIVMILISIVLIVMGYYSLSEIYPHLVASVFYMHSIYYHSWSVINPPVWTLEIEVQFYIIAPFLALALFTIKHKGVRRFGLIGLILILLLLQDYFDLAHGYTVLTILAHIHYFIIGFLLVDIYLNEWENGISKKSYFNYLAILAFGGAMVLWSWDHYLINRIFFSFSLFILVYSVFRSTWVNKFFTLPWITAIGGMCYTIYLIHLPIIEFFIKYSKEIQVSEIFSINFIIQLLLLIPVLLTFSIVFYLLIEKPCMHKDWPKQLRAYVLAKVG
ncbi:MAG: acyltransferase [Cyclobacteriaceae bacterium]|nr:acyltransferase [Cyclobacteriaceae bacterium]